MIAGSVVLVVGYWLATRPGAAEVQEGVVRWFNDPPAPVGWLLALTNPLFRPLPLAVIAVVLLGWLLWTAGAVGTVREVVVRTLRELRREGLVATGRSGITITSPERLLAEAYPIPGQVPVGLEHKSLPGSSGDPTLRP